MDNSELTGRVSLVTGSGRGIGKAIALKLAGMGSRVAINDLPGNTEAEEVVKEIENRGGSSMLTPADVTDSTGVKAAISQIIEAWGKIDILVNNAGISSTSSIMRCTENEWDKVLDINLKGAFICSRQVLRCMVGQSWGRIINIASIAGIVGTLGRVNYSASKGGLIAFTRSLAPEVGPRNITVNAIAPGIINTKMTEDLPIEVKEMVLSRVTLKRYGSPEDIAELAGFLASDRASYITGQVISVDGGII